jgi:hypothetical protein
MSKPVYVVFQETAGDRFHQGFTEFQGIYKTLQLAQDEAGHNWEWNGRVLQWKQNEAGADYSCGSRWEAKIGKGRKLVIEDYEVITEC